MKNRLLLLLLISFFAVSCNTAKKAAVVAQKAGFKYSYCTPTIAYVQPVWADDTMQTLSANTLSVHDRLIAKALGVNGFINSLSVLKKDTANDYKRLQLKQQINGRILIAQTQLAAVAGELDCEGERAGLAAIYVDNLNSKRNKWLTTTSVVTGALTTVATVIIPNRSGQIAVGVPGGLISAGLAALTISPKGKKVEFYHERNLLQSIWEDKPGKGEYPFVWQMLHEKQFSNSGKITLAQSIKARWLQFEFNGEIDPDQEQLLFGKGGFYHSDDLHTRAAMLNQLQSTVRSINQDLASFVVVMERL